jgi:hypothetical protein
VRTSILILQLASSTIFAAISLFSGHLAAQTYAPLNDQVLHVFQGGSNDGILPVGGVVFDANGNLYGATTYGGNGGTLCIGGSCGTVYQLVRPAKSGDAWTENILYNFTGVGVHQDGELPNGGLVTDAAANLYGVTAYGGTGGCILLGGLAGCGTVFELTPPSHPGGSWTKTTIYSFQGGADGYLPNGNLTFDKAGNLYGATTYGGGFGSCNPGFYQYCGTIFELSPPSKPGGVWTEKVVYSFKSGTDGANPHGNLVFDKQGALYGTTWVGGNQICQPAGGVGCGTVFKLQPVVTRPAEAWIESVLYRFIGELDGGGPNAGLVIDEKGRLYGTTPGGGYDEAGTVFALSPSAESSGKWHEELVLSFGGSVGALPMAGLVLRDDVLYGTAYEGGGYQSGTVFRLEATDNRKSQPYYAPVCDFPIGNQAAEPESQVTFDSGGVLYGTTVAYDTNVSGTVFRIGN